MSGRAWKMPEWLEDGIFAVQYVDSNDHITKRKGSATLEAAENSRRESSSETVDRLSQLGINLAIINLYLGGGLKEEREKMVKVKKLAEKLHRRGIKVGTLIQSIGTILTEPFLAEVPTAISWFQRDHEGRRPTYYSQYFRYIPCINHEEYLEYLEKVLKIAVVEVKADLLFFDNYGYYSLTCNCDACKERFRMYLMEKYPTEEARKERFGFADVSHIDPPPFRSAPVDPFLPYEADRTATVDPVEQEWIDFRCHRLGEVSKRINNFIKGLNPDTAVSWNAPYVGPIMLNDAMFHGIWPASIYPHNDNLCAECASHPVSTEDGVLETRIPYFKIGRAFHQGVIMHYLKPRPLNPLGLAESMAYGQHPFDLVATPLIEKLEPSIARYIQFYRDHKEYFKGAETLAEVGVWNSYPSLSYATYGPLLSLMLFQQTLIQAKVPFDLIFDEELQDVAKYPSLALPNVVAISDEQLKRLEEYLKEGGGLVLTDNTSLLNERRLRRQGSWLMPESRHAFADILGVEWPQRDDGPLKGTYGKGRFTIVPRIIPAMEPPTTSIVAHSIGPGVSYITPRYLKLPKNWTEIVEAVNWTSGERKVVTVKAPLTVTMELLRQEAENRLLLHLLNFDLTKAVSNIVVTLKPPEAKGISEVTLLSPDKEGIEKIGFAQEGGTVKFTVPQLQTHGIAVAQQA